MHAVNLDVNLSKGDKTIKGQVFKIHSNKYTVYCDGNYFECFARGNLKNKKQNILVGDYVEFSDGIISSVYNRFSQFSRPNIANIDCVNIVVGVPPMPDYYLIDKIIATTVKAGAEVYITLNKCDLIQNEYENIINNYKNAVSDIFLVSALSGEGIDKIKNALAGKTVVFAGQSAVGKTSITNYLFGKGNKVNTVSAKTLRGRHTTTYSEIHISNDFKICDTPGFSQVELGIKSHELKDCYPEFKNPQCYFLDCKHISEPDCDIKEKVQNGQISQDRYKRYTEIYNDLKKGEKYAKY